MSCDSLQEPDTFGAPLGNCLQDLRFEFPVQRDDHYPSCEHLIGEATLRAKKQSPFAESCYPRGTLSQAVDTLYVKAASLRATIPEDRIKNIRLLKKKTKKLFMKNCRFQEQLLSFFMEDVFGQLQLQVCKEMHFVEEFHSLRQKLSRCNSFENALSQFQQLSDFDRCHEGSKQEDAEGWRLGAVSQISCASSAREMKSITRMKRTFYEIGKKGIYKAISELDILLSWIKQFLESIK